MTSNSVIQKLKYMRKEWWRKNRILYPSPAEVRFVRLMGGRAIEIKWLRHYKTRFPLTIIVTLGRVLKRELCCREFRVGGMYVDFAFDDTYGRKRAIEIDGDAYHMDVVREQNRDDYLAKYGWKILHIRGSDLYRNPNMVQRRVLQFLSK